MLPELTQGDFRKKCLKYHCPILPIEAHTHNANLAEDVIHELKRDYKRQSTKKASPECLWDLCLVFCSLIRLHTALLIRDLDGEVPHTILTGDTADISHIVEFKV
jgi:hypothetical protein